MYTGLFLLFSIAGCSNLTSDALRKHDATQFYANPSSTPSDVSEMETELESSNNSSFKSSYSFASEWSNCSNMSYNRFLKVFRSDSALHKEMLAVLAAISEVINENGGSGTAVEYYCALVSMKYVLICRTNVFIRSMQIFFCIVLNF